MLEDSFSELEKGRLEKLEAMKEEGLEPSPPGLNKPTPALRQLPLLKNLKLKARKQP